MLDNFDKFDKFDTWIEVRVDIGRAPSMCVVATSWTVRRVRRDEVLTRVGHSCRG